MYLIMLCTSSAVGCESIKTKFIKITSINATSWTRLGFTDILTSICNRFFFIIRRILYSKSPNLNQMKLTIRCEFSQTFYITGSLIYTTEMKIYFQEKDGDPLFRFTIKARSETHFPNRFRGRRLWFRK